MLRDIELELMCEEQERKHSTPAVLNATDDMMTEYLMLGLEIKGQQCMFIYFFTSTALCLAFVLDANLLLTCSPTDTPPQRN
jgi:hypothetical protein